MAGKRHVFQRELGGFRGIGSSIPSAHWGHNPLAFERDCSSDPALVRRLACLAELPTQASSMSNVSWSEHGEFMVSGGEDCRVIVWSAEQQRAMHTLDLGHVAAINCVRFLPACNSEQLISCGSDRQVRLVSLRKNAVKPFSHHRGKVKTAAVLDPNIFMSGSEDGTVRQIDIREPVPNGSQDHAISGHDKSNVIADQTQERTGCARGKVGVNSMAVMPLNPHLFITGGTDALVRLYDRRMTGSGRGNAPSRVRWVSCYVPTHLKGPLITPRPYVSPSRSVGISGVAFTHDGQEILASYTSEQIYLFSTADHARPSHAFSASTNPAPNRAPGPHRPRTRHATEGGSRNAEAARVANHGGAAGRGTPPSGRAGSAPPVQPAPIGARPSSAQRGSAATAAGAAADSPTGGGEQEFRPLSHFLQRMRPALQRPTAAAGGPQLQSRQAPRRGASPSPESAGASRLRHGDAVQMRPSSGRASVGPSAGANGPGSAEEVGGARAASVPAAAEHDGGKGTQGAQQEQQEEVPTTSGVAPAAAQEEDMPASAEAAQDADGCPEEAGAEGDSPEEVERQRRASVWRASSRPASFTGSALPPMAHSVGQDAAAGTPSATALDRGGSPDPQAVVSPVRRSGHLLRSQLGSAAAQNTTTRDAATGNIAPDTAAPNDDQQLRVARRSKRRLTGGEAADGQPPANRSRRTALAPVAGAQPATLEEAAGQSGRVADLQADGTTAQELHALHAHFAGAGTSAELEPAEQTRPQPGSPDAGPQRVHALRRTGSTMAAEGHVFAVACSSAERPTASTGTSRPRRGDGRENELQSRLHSGRPSHAALPLPQPNQQPSAQRAASSADALQQQPPQQQRGVDPRSLPFPMPLPRRAAAARAAPATSSAVPADPATQPAGADPCQQQAANATSSISAEADNRAHAAPSRAGSSQRETRHAAGDGAAAGDAAREHGSSAAHAQRQNRNNSARAPAQAQSLPSSAAAIAVGGPGEDGEPDVVGPPAARAARRSVTSNMEGAEGRRRHGGVDSHVGAIMEAGDNEGDGEEVEESGMFQTSFHGHCNRTGCREVALMGSHSQYVVSGSDDGHIFVWDRGTGELANLLRSSDSGVSCVAPHPHLPMLASCGHDPIVRLWSPEAQEMANLEDAEAVMRRNAVDLTERQAAAAGPPPLWINMIAPPGLAADLEQRPRSPRGHNTDRGGNPVRCSIM